MRTLMMPHGFKSLNNSNGNTILGVLCLIAVSVAAFQMSLSNSLSVNGGIKNSRIMSARDTLESRIKAYSTMGATFRSSMYMGVPLTVNAELRNCIFGTGSTPCKADGAKHPVALYYPIYTPAGSSGENLKRMSGPTGDDLSPSESAFYDNKGNLCVANSTGEIEPNCPFFEVTTSFTATCAGGTATCTTAESISVNYMIKAAKTLLGSSTQNVATLAMKPINLSAPEISVTDILPAKPGSSASNVTISLSPSETTLSLESIQTVLKTLGIKDPGQLAEYSLAFQKSGVNDLSKIEFLLKVGQLDPAWMKIVVDSGITNPVLGRELYWSNNKWTPELLATTVAAVADVKIKEVAWAIADKLVTDPADAKKMADAVAAVKNPHVASGIIQGGHWSDPEKVQKITAAVAHIPDPMGDYLAQAGVTDSTIATKLVSIVSVVEDAHDAGWVLIEGRGDVVRTQEILTAALAYRASQGTPEATTTTTAPAPQPTPPANPVEISLMPTCTTCTPVTY